MTWFRYLKEGEPLGTTVKNRNYSYPFTKRKLPKFTPRDNLEAGTWITVDVKGLNIGVYYDGSRQKQIDHTSYLMVYESDETVILYDNLETLEYYTPVKCIVDGDNLFFQTAEYHEVGSEIAWQYSLYYHTPNLRYVTPVTNGPLYEVDQVTESLESPRDYRVATPNGGNYTGAYVATVEDVDNLTFNVSLGAASSYNFSFINSSVDWKSGVAENPGARVYVTFSGPRFELYGNVGPDFGKVKAILTGLSNDATPNSSIEEDGIVIDCYSPQPAENVLLFSRYEDKIFDKDYILDIQVMSEKNTFSSGNKFKISNYKFNYNIYSYFGEEEFSDKVVLKSSGMIRGQ